MKNFLIECEIVGGETSSWIQKTNAKNGKGTKQVCESKIVVKPFRIYPKSYRLGISKDLAILFEVENASTFTVANSDATIRLFEFHDIENKTLSFAVQKGLDVQQLLGLRCPEVVLNLNSEDQVVGFKAFKK